jgi:hypothetical protein
MKKITAFTNFLNWIKTTEMFARPSKQLPGKWNLFEYYIEKEGDLIHIKEEQLKAENLKWQIDFLEDEKYKHNSNLNVAYLSNIEDGTWSTSKNFITLIHPENFRNNIEFQFAIEKGNLKLLRKDELGKIEFFGFFRKQNSK